MVSPRFEAILTGKDSASLVENPFGMACIDQRWLKLLLVLAVTILLSVLPFKTPSVKVIGMSGAHSAVAVLDDSGPTLRHASSQPHRELAATHRSVQVTEKPNRKSSHVDLAPSPGRDAPAGYADTAEPARPQLLIAQGTRPPPCLGLRDPPGPRDLA